MWAKIKNRLANPTPAQVLFFLSPLLGEVVSSYQSPLEFLNPLNFVITVFPYGCGALIVRDDAGVDHTFTAADVVHLR